MNWARKRAQARSTSSRLRSRFEEKFEKELIALGVKYVYEKVATYFTPPSKQRRKTFDWHLTLASGKEIIIETKGYWDSPARLAELECIKQHPELDIRYVFTDSSKPIRKGSKTTYADVCQRNGVLYADGTVPRSWLNE